MKVESGGNYGGGMRAMGASGGSTWGGDRDPTMSEGSSGKSDDNASRRGSLKVCEVVGSLSGNGPFMGEGKVSPGGLIVK